MKHCYKTEIKIVIISKKKLDPEMTFGEIAVLLEAEEVCGDLIQKKVYAVSCDRAKEILDSIGKDSYWVDAEDADI